MYDPERAAREARAESARPIEIGTPTEVTPPRDAGGAGDASPRVTAGAGRAERSEPIRVFSMKAPGDPPEEREARPAKQHQARLRRLSEVSPQRRAAAATPPGGLGYLAPPRDPREARTRRWRDYLIWGSVAVILAGAVTLGVWFLAGR